MPALERGFPRAAVPTYAAEGPRREIRAASAAYSDRAGRLTKSPTERAQPLVLNFGERLIRVLP